MESTAAGQDGTRTSASASRHAARARVRRHHGIAPFLMGGTRLVVLLVFAAFFGLPLVWLVLAPSKTDDQLVTWNPFAFGDIRNYGAAWSHLLSLQSGEIVTWAENSVGYSAATVVLALFICLFAGYALATARFPGRRLLLWVTLFVMIVPSAAGVLPLFLEMNAVHLLNTPFSVVLPAAFYPFGVYLSYIYFTSGLPTDVLSAGRIDGCSETRLFWSVALPLAKPMAGLIAFFSFVGMWNNYFLPFVMLTDDRKFTLPVGLQTLITNTPALNPAAGGSFLPIKRPEAALAGLIVVVPVVILFLVAQRFVRADTLGGAEKG